MSYRLINSNEIAIKYPEVNEMDCIYVDLPNGLDNKYHYIDAEPKHGQWIATEKGAKITAYKCSECGRVVWDDTGYDVSTDYPYCHCGAKMNEV